RRAPDGHDHRPHRRPVPAGARSAPTPHRAMSAHPTHPSHFHERSPMPTPSRTISAIAALAVLALTACTPTSDGEATAASAEQPTRIVAVSSDVSDMALLLAGPERMAAVSESSRSPHMGMLPDLAQQVEATIPAGVEPDVEQILSHSPDLVLTTARHAGE